MHPGSLSMKVFHPSIYHDLHCNTFVNLHSLPINAYSMQNRPILPFQIGGSCHHHGAEKPQVTISLMMLDEATQPAGDSLLHFLRLHWSLWTTTTSLYIPLCLHNPVKTKNKEEPIQPSWYIKKHSTLFLSHKQFPTSNTMKETQGNSVVEVNSDILPSLLPCIIMFFSSLPTTYTLNTYNTVAGFPNLS